MSVARVSALEINGTLNSYGGPPPLPVADDIFGSVVNNGTINFAGSLHTLSISAATGGGDYTQGSLGTLVMRLTSGGVSDALAVADTATLDGILELTALAALSAGQTWALIGTGGGIFGDFDTKIFPSDGNPNWAAAGTPIYSATN